MAGVWALVVAAGRGERFGAAKQFWELAGVRLVDRAVGVAIRACDAVVVVVPPGHHWDGPAVAATVEGGATRSASVRAGLTAVPDDADVVVVHDAARPLAGAALFAAVIDAVRGGADGAVPVVPVVDTLRRVRHGMLGAAVERDGLVVVQTPQAFRPDGLRRAHAGTPDATDDATLVSAIGLDVVTVPGASDNLKITAPADLTLAHAIVAGDRGREGDVSGASAGRVSRPAAERGPSGPERSDESGKT